MGHSPLHGSEAESQLHAPSFFCRPSAFLLYTLQRREEDKWVSCWLLPPERKLSYHRVALRTCFVSALAAQEISSSFHQLLATSQTLQVETPWHFRILEDDDPCLSSAEASSPCFHRSYSPFSPWKLCHFQGRKCCLWAGHMQGVKRCLQRSAMSSHMPVRIFSGMWPAREESYEAVPLEGDRCRWP